MERRALLGGAIAVGLGGLGGCGRSVTPDDPPPPPSASPLPPDQLVFRIHIAPGLVPVSYQVFNVPALSIFGDGRVIRPRPERTLGDVPPELEVATVDPAAVAGFAEQAAASGLLAGIDYGSPAITDQPVTMIRIAPAGPPQQISVYALADPARDAELTGLNAQQRTDRARLWALLERARALPGDAPFRDFAPDRARLVELPEPTDVGGQRLPRWPGPDPDAVLSSGTDALGGRCAELAGEVVAPLLRAARDNPTTQWRVGRVTRRLLVSPLVPEQPACG
ncbi:hypothetical protein [Naumannella huperziae]